MIVHEIVLTCSNPHVARAAVASIGGDFAREFFHHHRAIHQKRQRAIGLPALGVEDLRNGAQIKRVRNERVERICRNGNNSTLAYGFRGSFDGYRRRVS